MILIGYVVRNPEGKYFRGYDHGTYADGGPIWSEFPLVVREKEANLLTDKLKAKSFPVCILE